MRATTLLSMALLLGCGKSDDAGPAAKADPEKAGAAKAETGPTKVETATPEQEALQRAREAAKKLGGTLKGKLTKALEGGNPAFALEMCASEAGTTTRGVGAQTGVRVGRSSLRLRNPENAGPRWVRQWLTDQGERSVSGAEGFARVDDTDQGKVARVLVPIGVEPLCLQCHGPPESLETGVRAALTEKYPSDRAVGYQTGDLRGALWAEARVK